jgi:hypothetical protein
LSLNSKEKYLCPVNCYNGLVIVITVHLNTQKYSKKSSQISQNVSLCNDSVIIAMIYEMYNDLVNRYNVSVRSDPTAIISKSL